VSLTVTVLAPSDPAAVWDRWTDFAAWPEWNPHCLEATLHGPLAPGSRLDLRLRHPRGRDFYTRPRLTEVAPRRELAWEATALGLRAVTTTRLEPEGGGTRVVVTSEAVGPLAVLYRMTFTDRAQATMYVGMLDALVDSLGAPAGEVPARARVGGEVAR
jgi:uncharacterized protein YndB with AHSA1/START domain